MQTRINSMGRPARILSFCFLFSGQARRIRLERGGFTWEEANYTHPGNLNDARRVWKLKLPLLRMYSFTYQKHE